jgi:hypothetical protein
MLYEHYKYRVEAREPLMSLQDIVASSRERESAEAAERERISYLKHKGRMEGFRAWVRSKDYLTEADQAEMIKASFTW